MVVNTLQQRFILGKRFWNWYLKFMELMGQVIQIGLIEDATPMIGRQCSQISLAEFQTLLLQTTKVGLVAYLIGRQTFVLSPNIRHISRRFGYHPLKQTSHLLNTATYGEDTAIL